MNEDQKMQPLPNRDVSASPITTPEAQAGSNPGPATFSGDRPYVPDASGQPTPRPDIGAAIAADAQRLQIPTVGRLVSYFTGHQDGHFAPSGVKFPAIVVEASAEGVLTLTVCTNCESLPTTCIKNVAHGSAGSANGCYWEWPQR